MNAIVYNKYGKMNDLTLDNQLQIIKNDWHAFNLYFSSIALYQTHIMDNDTKESLKAVEEKYSDFLLPSSWENIDESLSNEVEDESKGLIALINSDVYQNFASRLEGEDLKRYNINLGFHLTVRVYNLMVKLVSTIDMVEHKENHPNDKTTPLEEFIKINKDEEFITNMNKIRQNEIIDEKLFLETINKGLRAFYLYDNYFKKELKQLLGIEN